MSVGVDEKSHLGRNTNRRVGEIQQTFKLNIAIDFGGKGFERLGDGDGCEVEGVVRIFRLGRRAASLG